MKRCTRCYMPDTRPGSIFKDGVCQACRNFDTRKKIDWVRRERELDDLCKIYRGHGKYDCIIAVSGGKDSHRIVYEMKKRDMKPLLVTVGDPFTKTKAGMYNIRNLCEVFDCDHITFDVSPVFFRRVTRSDFEEHCEPLRFIERVIYDYPVELAKDMNIGLVMFGEDSSYIYGNCDVERMGIRFDDVLLSFMSYYFPWSSLKNLEIARRHGFKDLAHEWRREGYYDDFEQIDSMGYLIHLWLKYPKFGFQRTCDIVSRRIREGVITFEEGKRFIDDNDYKIDRKALDDFCGFCGYNHKRFWEVVDGFKTK